MLVVFSVVLMKKLIMRGSIGAFSLKQAIKGPMF